jgi:hypothetical protein
VVEKDARNQNEIIQKEINLKEINQKCENK